MADVVVLEPEECIHEACYIHTENLKAQVAPLVCMLIYVDSLHGLAAKTKSAIVVNLRSKVIAKCSG